MNPILDEVKYVVDNSKDVKINEEAIKDLAKLIVVKESMNWADSLPFKSQISTLNQKIAFNFVFNAINFSYWGNPKWKIQYQNKEFDGSWAMIGSIHRAIEEGIDLFSPEYLENLSEEDFRHILRGNIEVPLFQERLNILRDLGRIVNSKFQGDFSKILSEGNYDAKDLLNLIVSEFDFFNDFAKYNDKDIHFHKRAQLLISDIYEVLRNTENKINNPDYLAAFADYKIPQILRSFGVLEYSDSLSKTIEMKSEIPPGDSREVEIRATMVWAVELLRREVNNPEINSMYIDHYLWLLSQDKSEMKPYHLTRTIFY